MFEVGKQFPNFDLHFREVVLPSLSLHILCNQVLGHITRQSVKGRLLGQRLDHDFVAEQRMGFAIELAQRMFIEMPTLAPIRTLRRDPDCA